MTTEARRESWRRYDIKRKGTLDRLLKERARSAMRNVPKSGQCEQCNEYKETVWHHTDYSLPNEAIELCYRCHRGKHPR